MPLRYRISLYKLFAGDDEITPYRVAKDLGLNYTTVNKFMTQEVYAETMPVHVALIAQYRGVKWDDLHRYVELVEVGDAGEDALGEYEAALLQPA